MEEFNNFIEFCSKTYSNCLDILKVKNTDYTGGADPMKNFKLVSFLGVTDTKSGIIVRMCDKISRISTLIKSKNNPSVADEKIEDTIKDLINYSAILLYIIGTEKSKESKGENNDTPEK